LEGRSVQKQNSQILTAALNEYLKYQNKSDYIKDLTDKEVYELQIAELTGDINRASNYEAEIYYVGNMEFDQVYDILSKNLPLVANEKESKSPIVKDFATYTENTVYFLPNTDAEQSQIMFFMPGENYDKKDDVLRDAFNQYFSGGFNGLVLNEIREKRSMAYTAGAYVGSTGLKDKPTYFSGSIGTQNDKAIDALSVFMGLLNDMPKNPDRMENIKSYLRQEALTTHPDFRYKARVYESYKKLGYVEDPAKDNLSKIDALTFDDIYNFYLKNIKGHSIGIAVMGNPKNIKTDDLKKFGKVIKLSENKLFNDKDALF
jgi:Predicted Zn-dependent peptidases